MAIDLRKEQPVPFTELARSRAKHVSTVHRWRKPGLRGVCLEAIRIGGAWHTSHEAFQRFCDQLSVCETVVRLEKTADQGIDEEANAAMDRDGW